MKQNCMTLIELVVCVATLFIPVSAEEGATKARKASVISSVDNFDEADMASPRWQTNSNATAEISSADNGTTVSNVLSVKYSNRSPGPAAVIFPINNFDSSKATGIRFSLKGNADSAKRCDLVVNVKDLAGNPILYHSNKMDTDEAIQLKNNGWREYYISLKGYKIPPMFRSKVESIAFFFFDETDITSPVLLDNIAFVNNPADAPTLSEQYTAASAQTPHLFFNGDEAGLRLLRDKIRSGVPKQAFDILHTRVDEYLKLPTEPYTAFKFSEGDSFHFNGRIPQTHVTELAFVGLLLKDERYLRKAIDILLSCAEQAGPEEIHAMHKIGLEIGDLAMAFALGYDLLGAAMTDKERLLIKNELFQYGEWIFENSPTSHWGAPTPDTKMSNWNAVLHGPLGLIAILLDRDDWGSLAWKRVNGYLHYALDETGAPRESGTYYGLGATSAYLFAVAVEGVKGVNMLTKHSSRIRGLGRFYAEMLLPWGTEAVQMNQGAAKTDSRGWYIWGASEFEDPLWYWVFHRWDASVDKNARFGASVPINQPTLPFVILYYDSQIVPKSPEQLDLPLSHRFAKGVVTARSGWNDEDSLLIFKSDQNLGGWSHPDDNTFSFFANGEAIVSDPGRHLFGTKYENGLLIDGQGQAWEKAGHQVQGTITTFDDLGDHVVIRGDATEAYAQFVTGTPHLAIEKVVRTLVYVRDKTRPFILVLDDATMADGADHLWEAHYQFGSRGFPSTVELAADKRSLIATGAMRGGKSKLQVLWPPEARVEVKPLTHLVRTVSVKTTSVNPRFVTLIAAYSDPSEIPTANTKVESGSLRINVTAPGDSSFEWSFDIGPEGGVTRNP